ncbi:hypothetical protein KKG61_04020 [bacterium]|nr:hypothetical protein [bacterium]MBU1599255.1 hypothetical protein [bacterium]
MSVLIKEMEIRMMISRIMSALPSKEVLIAKVLQGMQSPIYGLVFTLKGLLTKLLYTLKAIEEKKQ